MTETVEIPFWLLMLVLAFAGVAALDRVLVPSVRWYLRRRFLRAAERINERLQLRIRPFKLLERRIMIDRLAHDPKVMEAVLAHGRKTGEPLELGLERAIRHARDIVPSFSVMAYFGFGTRAARVLSRALFRVRTGYVDDAALSAIDPEATVIFVMNHRSNLDYVLVTYLAAERSALSYAVGEWARVWPLQQVIRAMGGYFIRRRSNDGLYRRVLARYVQMATEGGVTQGLFPEGGLSLDGRLAAPKFGILSYILADFDPSRGRDVVFIPVGLAYDRVLEDRVLTGAAKEGTRRFRVRIGALAGFLANQLWLRVTGRFHRYGYASVSFGRPISLRGFLSDHPDRTGDAVGLAGHLMTEIGRVVPVLPVPVVASVLAEAGEGLSRGELAARCAARVAALRESGAHVHIPRASEAYMLETGLRMLTLRGIAREEGEQVFAVAEERPLLEFYANGIAHLLAPLEQGSGNNISPQTHEQHKN